MLVQRSYSVNQKRKSFQNKNKVAINIKLWSQRTEDCKHSRYVYLEHAIRLGSENQTAEISGGLNLDG